MSRVPVGDSSAILLRTEPHYHFESIDGREIPKPCPKNLHAFIETFLVIRLAAVLPEIYRAATELNVICGDDRLVPDITVMKRNASFYDGDLTDPPILVVEILSPGQMVGDLFSKSDRLLTAGAETCWVIWPERRQAWIYTGESLSEANDMLVAQLRNTRSALQVPLAELWAELD